MNFEYVDIHSHIYFPDFDSDRDAEILKLQKENIATITVGTDLQSSQEAVRLADTYNNLFATVGQHPGDVTLDTVFAEELISLAGDPLVVAIGECGLDYFRLPKEINEQEKIKDIQKEIFESHISIALHSGKPLMLHIRSSKGTLMGTLMGTQDAYMDALDILEAHVQKYGDKIRGNVHFFAGDMEVLKRFLAIGFSISFTGVLTFASDYDELVRSTPLDMIMSETDAPFVAPVPHRGKRNSPAYVPEVVKAIARIRGEDFETVKTTLRDNAVRFFGLKS